MSLSSTTSRVSFSGNGVTTAFSFPYYFLANADLVVILRVNSTGVETTKTLTTHYTVAGAGVSAGGTVTMITAPATGETLIVYRDPAITQGVDLAENDSLPAETLEQAFDRATMIDQRLGSRLDRAVRLSDGFSPTFDTALPVNLDTAGGLVPTVNVAGTGWAAVADWPIASALTSASAISTAVATHAALTATHGVAGEIVGTTNSQTLTNKTLTSPTINTPTVTVLDSALTVQDNLDTTKQLQLQLSGITTGTTRTLTVPNASTTIVGTDATQTLSAKTFSDLTTFTTSVKTPLIKNASDQSVLDLATRTFVDSSGLNVGSFNDTYFAWFYGNLFWSGDSTSYAIVRGPVTGSTNYTVRLPNVQGAANTFMRNDGAGILTWTKAALATDVSGTLPIANGGTNNAALAVTAGGTVYTDGSKLVNVGAGTAGQVLTSQAASAPTWSTPASAPSANYEMSNLTLACSVATNALTISLKDSSGADCSAGSAAKIGFRNSTAATGTYNQRSVTAALSTVISSGSTAEHMNATNHYLFIYALDNAGTVELAWSSKLFDETQVQTTTAEGGAGAADSSTVLYSTTARTNVPIRLLGYLQSNQTTAGTYAAVPTRIFVGPIDWERMKPVAEFVHTGGTSIPTATVTTIEYDSVTTDNWSMSNAGSTTNWKAYIKVPGKYRVGLGWGFNASTLATYRRGDIRVNNSTYATTQTVGNASYGSHEFFEIIINLVIGDYITGVVDHDAGVNVALTTTAKPNHLNIEWVAP